MTVSQMERVARTLAVETDRLFDEVRSERQRIGRNVMERGEVETAYMLAKMRGRFETVVTAVANDGYGALVSQTDPRALAHSTMTRTISELEGCTALMREGLGAELVSRKYDERRKLVEEREKFEGATFFKTVAPAIDDPFETLRLAASNPSVPAVVDEGMEAFFKIALEDPEWVAFQAAYAADKVRSANPTTASSKADGGKRPQNTSSIGVADVPLNTHPFSLRDDVQDERVASSISSDCSSVVSDNRIEPALDHHSNPSPVTRPTSGPALTAEPTLSVGTSNGELPTFLGFPDRWFAYRAPSDAMTLSEKAELYIRHRETKDGLAAGSTAKDSTFAPLEEGGKFVPSRANGIRTLRMRLAVFISLIGDHPIDRYDIDDFQYFVDAMTYYPRNEARNSTFDRAAVRALLQAGRKQGKDVDRLARKTLQSAWVGGLRPIFRWKDAKLRLPVHDPVAQGLAYDSRLRRTKRAKSLPSASVSDVVLRGIEKGSFSRTMMPVLGIITSRRLGALAGLRGSSIREAYPAFGGHPRSVFTADPSSLAAEIGLKSYHSEAEFVLHEYLEDIGFIEFAISLGDDPVFSRFFLSSDPMKYASRFLNDHFKSCGCTERQVFHSTRGDGITGNRAAKLDSQVTRHQAGHAPVDVHDSYGELVPEPIARELATTPLPEWLEAVKPALIAADFSTLRSADYRTFRPSV